MDPERWQTVQEILLQALELEPEQRSAYLVESCPDDGIRHEVQSLLGSDTAVIRGLDQPAVDLLGPPEQAPGQVPGTSRQVPGTLPEQAPGQVPGTSRQVPGTLPEQAPGQVPGTSRQVPGTLPEASSERLRIGPYRLLHELGRGGMGTVWLAARDDREFERRVAIKILKRGMDTDEIERRFRLERQILANLEHPHIAELYEGGTTEDHRPYFVMEYVEGSRIDHYCDQHALRLDQRLALFRKVCDAVQFLHRNLVVHRDLKPSNILVTAGGEPKLLDFGIAKLLDPTTHLPLTLTARDGRWMTPEYASPEQVRGEPITTASDVYALGVLLYQLLTGHRPYRLPSRLEAEVHRIICEVEPAPPSAAVTRTEIVRDTTGKNTTIDPETVGRMRGERPAKLRRRLSGDLDKIVLMALRKEPERRYASVALLAEDLDRHLGGLPVRAHRDSWLYRTRKLLGRRWREAAVLGAVLLLSVLYAAKHFEQQRRVAEERDQALRVTRFLTELFQVSDPYLRQEASLTAESLLERGMARIEQEPNLEPEIRAALLQTIGEVYRRLALFERAEPLLEEALALRRSDPGSLQVAETLASLAALRADQSDLDNAEERYRTAVDIARRSGPGAEAQLASWLNALAFVLQDGGDYEGGEALHREALAIQRRLFGNDHPEVARTLNDLGMLHLRRDDLETAEMHFRQALAIERRHFAPRHPRLESVSSNLASVLMAKGQNAAAEPLLREALEIARTAFGDDHPSVARTANNLAAVRRKLGDLEEAEALFRRALATARRAYGDDHPNVARTMNGLAGVLQEREQLTTAESLLRESLAILQRHLGPEHPGVASTTALLAELLVLAGDPLEGESLAREALEIFRARLPPDHVYLSLAEQILGAALLAQDRHDEAESLLVASHRKIVESRGPDDPESREARARLVELYRSWGRPEQAERYR